MKLTSRLLALLAGLSLSALTGACRGDLIAPPLSPPSASRPLGLIEVTISGLGSGQQAPMPAYPPCPRAAYGEV